MPPARTESVEQGPPRRRRGLACERCRGRKQKCLPGSGSRCRNCENADTECQFLEKTAHELHLQRYTAELEGRIQQLETFIKSSSLSLPRDADAPAAGPSTVRTPTSAARSQTMEDGDSEPGSENLATGVGFLSLSGGAEPLYLGGSSGVGWAKVLMQSLHQKSAAGNTRVPRPMHGLPHASTFEPPGTPIPLPPAPPEAVGNHYISTVYYRIQARYGFLDWVVIQSWQARSAQLCLLQPLEWGADGHPPTNQQIEDGFGAFFLWMLYGLGAKLCEHDSGMANVSHEVYYNTALRHFISLSHYQSISTVQALLLLVVYIFRHTTSGLSLWHAGGIAVRSAIELGLHRRIRSVAVRERDPRAYCMRQRVFWGAYILDRMISIQYGRPFAIQDRDIDIELPINLDANIADNASLCSLLAAQANLLDGSRPGDEYRSGYGGFSSMTSFIHTIRLSQIKTKIHELVYTVDHPTPPEESAVLDLMRELDAWQGAYPSEPDVRIPACSHEFFELEYHGCVQILLRPLAARADAPPYFLNKCAASAAAVLDIECQLLRRDSKNLATWVLAKIFMSGLTLLHVVWNHPDTLPAAIVSRALRSCSTCLFLYAQQFSTAGAYLDCFEDLVKAYDERKISGALGNTDGSRMPASGSGSGSGSGAGTGAGTGAGVAAGSGVAGNGMRYPQEEALEQQDLWSERLDNLGGMMPGMREDLATLMTSFGLVNPNDSQAPLLVDPMATPANGNGWTWQGNDQLGDLMWEMPFDAWAGNGSQGVPGVDFAGLFGPGGGAVGPGGMGMEMGMGGQQQHQQPHQQQQQQQHHLG